MEALRSTSALWEGELDYQSGQRFRIPMRAGVNATPDGATMVRRVTWTDPGNLLHAVVLSTIDRDTGELVEACFREGKGEYPRYEVARSGIESSVNCTIEFERNGSELRLVEVAEQ